MASTMFILSLLLHMLSPVALQGTPIATDQIEPSASVGKARVFPESLLQTLPEGDKGGVSIVASSPYSQGGSVALIRNNTDTTVEAIALSAIVLNDQGGAVAAGASTRLHPNVLEPGEVALALIQYQGAASDGSAVELSLTSRIADEATRQIAYPAVDYSVEALSVVGDQVVGTILNDTDEYPLQSAVIVLCLDAQGVGSGWALPSIPQGTWQPGQIAPFFAPVNPATCVQAVATGGGLG